MPQYIFEIDGKRHVFEGPDPQTTAQFAQQWAATAGRPGYTAGQKAADPVTGYLTTAARAVPGLTELGAGYSAALSTAADAMAGRPLDFGARFNEARGEQQGVVDKFGQDHPLASANATAWGLSRRPPLSAGSASPGPEPRESPPSPQRLELAGFSQPP